MPASDSWKIASALLGSTSAAGNSDFSNNDQAIERKNGKWLGRRMEIGV
jgi:hypothetical protein